MKIDDIVSNDSINELIIHNVHSNSMLWDSSNPGYKDNLKKKFAWIKLAKQMNLKEDFIRLRWKSLRDRYIKEKKKSAQSAPSANHVPWSFSEHLEFLDATINETLPHVNTIFKSSSSNMSISASTKNIAGDNADEVEVHHHADEESNDEREEILITNAECASKDPTPLCSESSSSISSRQSSISGNILDINDNIELGVDDPDVDEANLNDSSSGSEGFLAKFSPDELFYFFISRNSKQLNAMNKLRLQQTVLNSFVQILNEQNKKK